MLLTLAGASMVAYSVIRMTAMTRSAELRRQTKIYFDHCNYEPMKLVRIKRTMRVSKDVVHMEVVLPYGMEVSKFESHINGIQLASSSEIMCKHLYGRVCRLAFGFAPFSERMNYNDTLPMNGLSIPLYTPFGILELNFSDETNCHMLQGGATRMGKTVLFRLICTHLLRSTHGHIDILLIDNKVTDVNMFQNIPQIQIAETLGEAKLFLEDKMSIIKKRKELLKSKNDVVDLKEFREKYPEEKVDPIFIMIDEYGRFAEDKPFQELVTEIAETAGYLDVHLIISAQRPDAKSVLNPRIKANIVTRISFSTSDETNSKIILDLPDAAHLGMIQGRAYLLDSVLKKIQVPYLSSDQSKLLLLPYYRREGAVDAGEGPENNTIPEEIPGIIADSLGEVDMPRSGAALRNRKQNRKTTL